MPNQRSPRYRFTVLFAALGAFGLSGAGYAQVVPPAPTTLPTPLTLKDAIGIALQHQPQEYIARNQISQAQGQKQQAKAQYYPKLTPSYQFQNRSQSLYGLNTGSSVTNTTGTGTTGTGTTGTGTGTTGTGTTGTVVTTNSTNEVSIVRGGGLALSLTQNLYDGGAREATNAQARRAVDAAGFNQVNTRQDIILAVTQDYYQLLLAQDLVKVAQAQVARFQQTVEVTQAQITAGTVAAKDVYQAQADLASAQVTLLQNQNQVQTVSSALKTDLGVETDAPVQLAPLPAAPTPAGAPAPAAGAAEGGPPVITIALPAQPTPGPSMTLDEAVTTAFTNRPDLRQQQAIVESSKSALQQARRDAGLKLGADYVLDYQATNDIGARGLSSQLLITGSYPLFDAGAARGAVRVSQAQFDSAQNQLEQARQQIRQGVEQSYMTREFSLQAAQLAQAAVTAAQVNYDAAVAARQAGAGTVQDITLAQATLTQSQNQYVTAIYNFYTADAQLQRAIGTNDTPYLATR